MEEKDPQESQASEPQGGEENSSPQDAQPTPSPEPALTSQPLPGHESYAPPSIPELPNIDAIRVAQHVDVKPVYDMVEKVRDQVGKVVIGQDHLIELMIASILVGGHCLIEGLPGIAKTLTSKMLSQSISAQFSRIQFTPDLMPTDITGTSVFNQKEFEFIFRKGPIFSNIILIDEINRAPAKTQAALMEVMEERQITYDGKEYKMDEPFFVIATQNPIEQEGTYNLPEAQLDRFLFRIKIDYPSLEEEQQILRLFENDFEKRQTTKLEAVVSPADIAFCQKVVEKVHIKSELLDYIAALTNNTRNNGDLFVGASPRASLAIMKTSKAIAAIRGRDFVTPDDIKYVAMPVMNHRVIISHEREMEGSSVEEIISEILNTVEIPR
jgi:MoxR-like ATPase